MISVLAYFKYNLLHDERLANFINDCDSNQVKLVAKSIWLAKNSMLTNSSKELENPDVARTTSKS